MEQQEETKRKIPKRRTKQSKPTSSFPLDLTSEILLRLPAKSVVRSRCVSKLWSAITTDPYFTNSFKTRHLTRLSVLMFFKTDDKLFVFSIPPDHQNSNESYTSSLPIIDMKDEDSYFFPTESVHGLICFQDSGKPIVWNPSMRQFLTLPKPKESSKHITCFLGYDPTEGKHKVMCMPRYQTCDECRVLTLGSAQESWRTVKTNHRHRPLFYTHGRCINGVVYYEAHLDDLCNIIMSFDVRSEKFGVITLPTNISYGMLRYEGRLAYVVSNLVLDCGITLWILEDAEKHEWSFKHFLAPFHYYDPNLETLFSFDGITHAGECIYVLRKSPKTLHILYFDPKRNSFRKTEFADEEFRLSSGLGDRIVDGIHSCPDHIESLMSL